MDIKDLVSECTVHYGKKHGIKLIVTRFPNTWRIHYWVSPDLLNNPCLIYSNSCMGCLRLTPDGRLEVTAFKTSLKAFSVDDDIPKVYINLYQDSMDKLSKAIDALTLKHRKLVV